MNNRTCIGLRLAAGIVLCAGMLPAAALAECQRPRPTFEIPDGSSVTEQELASVQKEMLTFSAQAREYLQCLSGETSQKSVGKDETVKEELARTYVETYQSAANELNGLVDCFNAQLRSFKSTGGGKQKRAADCSAHMSAAANRAQSDGAAAASQLVVESSGHTFEIPGGSWLYYLVRDDVVRRCGGQQECFYRAVLVRNDSDEVLECSGEITYEGTDIEGKATTASKTLVSERSTYILVGSSAQRDVNAQTFEAKCTPRAKLPALATKPECKYQVVQPVTIADYYPEPARQAGEEGPVIVEFTLSKNAAKPTKVQAVASSLYPSLDEAAVKAVSDMVMSSNCDKARYRLKLSFVLDQ